MATHRDDFTRLDRKLATLSDMADVIESEVGPEICEVMRVYALDRLDALVYDGNSRPVTGNLRNSVETAQDVILRTGDATVSIGIASSADYALFIEYGTGALGDPAIPHTSKPKWFYFGPDGSPHWGYPQHPRPFMRPALYDNVSLFKDIIEGKLTEVFA